MKRIFYFFSLIALLSAAYAQVYKWTDDKGTVHYSDQPQKGAVLAVMPAMQTYAPPPPPITSPAMAIETHQGYVKILITKPINNDAIFNISGMVNIVVTLEPELMMGDRIQLIFDGIIYGPPETSSNFMLDNVLRGSHTVQARILDMDGRHRGLSNKVLFHVQRPKVPGMM